MKSTQKNKFWYIKNKWQACVFYTKKKSKKRLVVKDNLKNNVIHINNSCSMVLVLQL